MGRKKKGTGVYFTQETENAILKYPTLTNKFERDRLYADYIHKAFLKIAEVWYNKIDTPYIEEEPLDAQMDCVIFMFQKLEMFKADKGKAFSYFSIVARNYYIVKNKKNYVAKKKKMMDLFDDDFDIEDKSEEIAEMNSHYETIYPLFVQWIKDNFDTLFRIRKQKEFGIEILKLLETDIDSIEDFNSRNIRTELYDKLENTISRPQLTKLINKLGIYFLQFNEQYRKNGTILSELNTTIPESKKSWIRETYVANHRRYGVTGMSKVLKIPEADLKVFLIKEKLL